MTNEEAIKEIRGCLGFNKPIMPYSDEMEAFGMAITALEKSDKYRWHDLSKNPEDLPSGNWDEWLLVKVKYIVMETYVTCTYVRGDFVRTGGSAIIGKVIAWRYIEPFEEDA